MNFKDLAKLDSLQHDPGAQGDAGLHNYVSSAPQSVATRNPLALALESRFSDGYHTPINHTLSSSVAANFCRETERVAGVSTTENDIAASAWSMSSAALSDAAIPEQFRKPAGSIVSLRDATVDSVDNMRQLQHVAPQRSCDYSRLEERNIILEDKLRRAQAS
eukprot:2697685-Pyramimonas_sp.AAC.2